MPHATSRRIPFLSLLLPAALLVAACDRGDELETPEALDDRAAEAAPAAADADGPSREHARHGGKGKKLDRLCESLACTDAQRVRIDGLAERLWAERPEPTGDRDAANRTLAQAFASGAFATADLQAHHAAAGPDAGEMEALVAEAVVELHGILDAEQRATLADKVEQHGLPFAGGRGPKHGRHGDDDRGAKLAERLCETIACSTEQVAAIATLVQGRPAPGEVPEAERTALATAFRGATLADEPVNAYLDAAAKVRVQDRTALEAGVVELHGLLTPEQRATLAEQIAEDGPRALMGGKGKHGKGKHGRGGKKGRRGPQGKAEFG